VNAPTFKEAFLFWLKLGFISFGGPAGQIAIMHEELVVRKKWIDEDHFNSALSFCMLLPGPEAQQLATYSGWLLHGTRGGLAAGILFILPSVFILLGLSIVYVTFGEYPVASDILYFLRPAVLGIIVFSFLRLSKKSVQTQPQVIAAFIAFFGMTFFDISFPWLIVAALISGWFIPYHSVSAVDVTVPSHDPPRKHNSAKVLAAGFLLLVLPIVFVVLSDQDFRFWSTLALFFTKAACITFGGAYAVLPYVADVTVNDFGWLNQQQMIDGLALGETTPGPLIMVLAFVGFMAGFHQSAGSVLVGTAGLLITVWYTFLPGFIFVFLGAPFVQRFSASARVKGVLKMVGATVAGVILNLAWTFGKSVLFTSSTNADLMAIVICAAVIYILYKNLLSVPVLVGAVAVAGLVFSLSIH
jgi:chromate transporter